MPNEPGEVWWQTPRAWLYAWDLPRDSARFVKLDRQVLGESSFLDQRMTSDVAKFREAAIEELLSEPIRGAAKSPPNFIFHSAFCCSTLLARSLDIAGRTLVLREPTALLQLADLKRGLTVSGRSLETLLPLTLGLLARPFAPNERIIIKPTNLADNLGADILALQPNARALVLYDDLEPFLLAVLKRPRESARGIAEFLRHLLADPLGHGWAKSHVVPDSLAARAALAWMLQIRGLETWCAGEQRDRIRVLRADELLDEPLQALAASARWLGVDLLFSEADAIVRGPLWRRHAKNPALPFDPGKRREEQTRARQLLREPIREGLAWAAKSGTPVTADFARGLGLFA